MSSLYRSITRGALFNLDAELAHGLAIKALRAGLHPRFDGTSDPRLATNVAGLEFPNPLGMAAGFDKRAEVASALLATGFGHAEAGTITPQAQPGNPKPRIFRLPEDEAVINRLGFNSDGHADARERLLRRGLPKGILGINIGANKTSEDFAADYVSGIKAFGDLASYFTVNISSPNTPGLRALQGADPLADLLSRVGDARAGQLEKQDRAIPVFLKIAPDLDEKELDEIADALNQSDIDGVIVSNTTLSRAGLSSSSKSETGGLSGRPLFERSTIVLAKMRQRLDAHIAMIGVGGVRDAETAFQKIEAGASLVQLYTALIYEGPALPRDILKGLSKRLDRENSGSLSDIVGRKTEAWAKRALPPS